MTKFTPFRIKILFKHLKILHLPSNFFTLQTAKYFFADLRKYKEYDDNKTNPQSQLLQDIKKILEEKYPGTPIKANEKIVAVQFADGTHDVEVVPAWELTNGSFRIPNSGNGGSWEDYDYRADIARVKDSEAKTGQTKFLIRAIKKWYDNCSVQVKTFEIEESVLSFFDSNTASQDRASLIKNFFEYFLDYTDDDKTKSHITTAINRAKKAVEFETNGEYDKAIDEWVKIFGNDFPKTINKTDNSIDELRKAYPSSREQFLDKDFNIPFRIDSRYSVKIDADVEQDGFRKKTLTEYILDKLPLRKRKSLSFKIISCNVPYPYQIKWKVRNFGEEAQNANDLRGEISNDGGRGAKTENTKYRGEHYVECYITLNPQKNILQFEG
jgi:hypothetical protein